MILKIYELPIWLIGLLIAASLLLAIEVGAWNGRRIRAKPGDVKQARNIARNDLEVGALLALLGLILAFSYSFGLSRLDLRKEALLQETNSISTAFVRADLLPEPVRSELRSRLRDYAVTRVLSAEDTRRVSSVLEKVELSQQAQDLLWPTLKQALDGDIPGHVQMLNIQSINDLLDADTTRNAVGWDRFPLPVFGYLVALGALAVAMAAQNAERKEALSRVRVSVFAFALATLIFIIIDFDNSSRGLIQLNQGPLTDLIEEMEKSLAS